MNLEEEFFPADDNGFVPSVSPADLKAVWNLWRDMAARTPGQNVGIGQSVYQGICSPGADTRAVYYRAAMLQMVRSFRQQNDELPDAMQPIVELPDAVFEITAKFPMKSMRVGVSQQGLPFDVEEFGRQVEQAGRKL
jgi:hypothetical protein